MLRPVQADLYGLLKISLSVGFGSRAGSFHCLNVIKLLRSGAKISLLMTRSKTMKVQANTIRPGNVIEHDGKQWSVLKITILQPGKGGAFVQAEIRDIKSGNKSNERFRTQETVAKLMVDERPATFLFRDDTTLTLMDTENYEQFELPVDMVGEPAIYLQDGMELTVDLVEGNPVSASLPPHVTMVITEAEPVVKGQTASSSYKPGVLENGQRVLVPHHIEAGSRIVVSTEDGSYVERAKD